jgi:hypothetical protein
MRRPDFNKQASILYCCLEPLQLSFTKIELREVDNNLCQEYLGSCLSSGNRVVLSRNCGLGTRERAPAEDNRISNIGRSSGDSV